MDPNSSPYIIPKNSLRNPFPHCLLRTRLERERARERERETSNNGGAPAAEGCRRPLMPCSRRREREREECVCVPKPT